MSFIFLIFLCILFLIYKVLRRNDDKPPKHHVMQKLKLKCETDRIYS